MIKHHLKALTSYLQSQTCEKGNSWAIHSMEPDNVQPCAVAATSTDSSGNLLLHEVLMSIAFQQEGKKKKCLYVSQQSLTYSGDIVERGQLFRHSVLKIMIWKKEKKI